MKLRHFINQNTFQYVQAKNIFKGQGNMNNLHFFVKTYSVLHLIHSYTHTHGKMWGNWDLFSSKHVQDQVAHVNLEQRIPSVFDIKIFTTIIYIPPFRIQIFSKWHIMKYIFNIVVVSLM